MLSVGPSATRLMSAGIVSFAAVVRVCFEPGRPATHSHAFKGMVSIHTRAHPLRWPVGQAMRCASMTSIPSIFYDVSFSSEMALFDVRFSVDQVQTNPQQQAS